MMAVCYAPIAGLRGLWVGPYFTDVFGADAPASAASTLIMGLAMVAGNFAYGPLDRCFGTRKWVIFTGNAMAAGLPYRPLGHAPARRLAHSPCWRASAFSARPFPWSSPMAAPFCRRI